MWEEGGEGLLEEVCFASEGGDAVGVAAHGGAQGQVLEEVGGARCDAVVGYEEHAGAQFVL